MRGSKWAHSKSITNALLLWNLKKNKCWHQNKLFFHEWSWTHDPNILIALRLYVYYFRSILLCTCRLVFLFFFLHAAFVKSHKTVLISSHRHAWQDLFTLFVVSPFRLLLHKFNCLLRRCSELTTKRNSVKFSLFSRYIWQTTNSFQSK